MEDHEIIMAHEERLQKLEETTRRHEGLILAAEDKASNAWKSINEVKQDVGDLYDKVEELDKKMDNMNTDMKIMKTEQQRGSKKTNILIGLSGVTIIICVAFFVYLARHDSALAKEILTFGAATMKVVV